MPARGDQPPVNVVRRAHDRLVPDGAAVDDDMLARPPGAGDRGQGGEPLDTHGARLRRIRRKGKRGRCGKGKQPLRLPGGKERPHPALAIRGRKVQEDLLPGLQVEADFGEGQGGVRRGLDDARKLRPLGFQEFEPGRGVKEEVPDFDGRPGGRRSLANLDLDPALDDDLRPRLSPPLPLRPPVVRRA